MKKEKKRNYIPYILLAIIVITLIIVIYIVSLGQIDLTAEKKKHKEKVDAKNQLTKLELRHEKLKTLIQKKEILNIKLNKRFKLIYFGVRLALMLLTIAYNFILYFVFNITELSSLLKYNSYIVLIVSLFSFIAFGTLVNLKEFTQKIKLWLEVKIYSKYANITKQIETHKEEEISLIASIDNINKILIESPANSNNQEDLI